MKVTAQKMKRKSQQLNLVLSVCMRNEKRDETLEYQEPNWRKTGMRGAVALTDPSSMCQSASEMDRKYESQGRKTSKIMEKNHPVASAAAMGFGGDYPGGSRIVLIWCPRDNSSYAIEREPCLHCVWPTASSRGRVVANLQHNALNHKVWAIAIVYEAPAAFFMPL